ncbi:hypothetical protein HPB51_004336 [Rhipicephalus microplus]|uniref:SAM domain-containing protein n=1 Tax=Rhipicephalus microplus TaxID=6941 RepID=A0A9J6ELE2_RHIMP|nr:hypothetical protein HPB51_004336 [Rhipicephalus microplus]
MRAFYCPDLSRCFFYGVIVVADLPPPFYIAGDDYIWGLGCQGKRCQECGASFHAGCSGFAGSRPCLPPREPAASRPGVFCSSVSLSEWSSENVQEWLAAINMLSCGGEALRELKGADLAGLDRERLCSLGLKEEAAQDALLRCLAELCRAAPPPPPAALVASASQLHQVPYSSCVFDHVVFDEDMG